ncbi:hypothetical protein MMC08_002004 [Hypocenomyce scalaris]|nr:hypothetical protein [Hypocenomyce scalaris]
MGLFCFLGMIRSLRTNGIFVGLFTPLVPSFGLLAGSFWNWAQGKATAALNCQKGAGALLFVICWLGWYLFFAMMVVALDFPFILPVGDLSALITGATEKARRKKELTG